MNVSLTHELEQLVNSKVTSGMYQTASEVVREALRLLMERDQRREALRHDIRGGFAQVERGEFFEYDERTTRGLAKQVKARGRQRLSARRKTGTR